MFDYKKFRDLCYERNISESKVAQDIGLSRAAVTGWRKGAQPSARVQTNLARYFGISVLDLETECDDDFSHPDDNLVKDFIEEMRQKNTLTEDENLMLMMFRSVTDEQRQNLIKTAMKMVLKDETR